MKKRILLLLLTALLILSLSACNSSYSFYNDNSRWDVYVSGLERRAFVNRYNFYMDMIDDREIEVPDEVGGMPVESLGGYSFNGPMLSFQGSKDASVPFYICPDWYFQLQPDLFKKHETFWLEDPEFPLNMDDYEMVYMDFTVHIGKNINEIVDVMDTVERVTLTDGSVKLYRVRYYFVCDEENKTFYSKDGKLYERWNDGLVDKFCYVEP